MTTLIKLEDSSLESASNVSTQDVKNADLVAADDRKAVDSSLASLRWNYWLGLTMHIFLVLIHVALIAVLYAGHLENRISVPLGRPANIASVVIVVVTQVVNQVRLYATSTVFYLMI